MALTDFRVSPKTRRPRCCDFCCCGNSFGRIERSEYCKVHSGVNRIKRTRRYAKHVERQNVQKDIRDQVQSNLCNRCWSYFLDLEGQCPRCDFKPARLS